MGVNDLLRDNNASEGAPSMESDRSIRDCTDKYVSSFRSMNSEKCSTTKVIRPTVDKMTDLINFQKSNGAFKISSESWSGSVLEEYLGSYSDVKSNCPTAVEMDIWITALSIKILEIKMEDEKELWDLVVRKSHKFLDQELCKLKEIVIDQAEKYVKNK